MITSRIVGPLHRTIYSYDPTGNRILTIKDGARTTSTFDPANQNAYSLDANGRTTYTFDQSGNRIEVLKPDGSRTTTSYDFENRDLVVQLPSGLRNTMAYDPDGLRVLLQESAGTKKFIYDNQQYLLQTDGSNVITAVQTQEPGTYSNLLSQYQFDGSLWLPNYYHYDSLGNTSELTNSTQIVTDTYDYNAWGELLAQTGTTANPFQYRGRYGYFTNPHTGEIYVIMRTYAPMAGRWTTTDILRFVDGLNMYMAVFVPNGIDLTGMDSAFDVMNSAMNKASSEKLASGPKNCVFTMSDPERQEDWDTDAKRYRALDPLHTVVFLGVNDPSPISAIVRTSGCCSLTMIGHRGGSENAGIVTTSGPVIPNEAFANQIANAVSANKCRSCDVRIFACQLGCDPLSCKILDLDQAQQAQMEKTNFKEFATYSTCTLWVPGQLLQIGINHTCVPSGTETLDAPSMTPYSP